MKKCTICGSSFDSGRTNAKYCSDRCRKKAKYLSGKRLTICQYCGREFLASSVTTKYCSQKCSGTAQFRSPVPVDMSRYHSDSLDRKIRDWDNYGKQQGYRTLLDVGRVDVDGIMGELKR